MSYQFNVPQPFAVPQQPQSGSMFAQQMPQFAMHPQYGMNPYQQGMQQPMPQPMQHPLTGNFQPQPQQQPQPMPHPLTGNFQPMGQPQVVNHLTQSTQQPATFNPALANPTPYMGKTMQPQGVYAESVPDYNAPPMPATGINALGFGTQPTPMPTVTR